MEAEDTQLWGPTQSYLMTGSTFLCEYLYVQHVEMVHCEKKATIHTSHNKETFI